NVVALDLGVDLSTAAGQFLANVMASAAEWERAIIGQRTRDALAAKRAQGHRLGRPRQMAPETTVLVVGLRSKGMTFAAVADELNRQGVPTTRRGATWYPSTVRAVMESHRLDQEAVA